MNNIKARREQLGLSQVELAKMCDITKQQMCDIEKGRTKPTIKTAIKISKALKISSIRFFE